MFRWKRLAAAAIAITTMVGLTSCAADSQGGSSDGSGGTLTLGAIQTLSTFAAADSYWANESPYMQAVYDTVLRAEPDGTITEGLASEWTYNEDGTVLTLKIRDGVTFSDGSTLDADAVAQNLIRFRDGNSPDTNKMADLADAVATDASTVTVTLKQANPTFLFYLTQNAGLVEAPSAFESADIQTTPVGSGPYELDASKTVVGTSYAFTKRDGYWDEDSVHYDDLVINVYSDSTALVNALKGGQVNAATTVDNNDITEIEASGFTVNPLELNWTGLLLLDRDGTSSPALKDVRVRQAINYAFDKDALLKAVGQGYGTVTTQIFPESSEGYDPSLDSYYDYDLDKAKELMSEAGYADGFTLQMPSSALVGSSTFTLIQQQLSEIGITVEYTDAGNNFIADVLAPKYPATWLALQQDPDWALIQFELSPNAIFNPYKTTTPELETLIENVRTADEAGYADAVKAVNTWTVENAWFAPWYRPQLSFVTDANTKVEVQTGNAYPYLWNITPA